MIGPIRKLVDPLMKINNVGFIAIFALAVIIRFVVILLLDPGTDVYYYDMQAAKAILNGEDPYGHLYSNIPDQLITPGADRVFAYLPFTALYLIPFYLLGDVRYGFLLADVIIAVSLYLFGGRYCRLASLVFLLLPFTLILSTLYLNNSIIAIAFLSIFLLLEMKGKRYLHSIFLGLALASIQFTWLIFPFLSYYLISRGKLKAVLLSLAVAASLILPFVIIGVNDFLYDTLFFQLSRKTLELVSKTGPLNYNLNPSINGVLITFAGFALPFPLRAVSVALLLIYFILRTNSYRALLFNSATFLIISLFILPNNFFWSYIELPITIYLMHISNL